MVSRNSSNEQKHNFPHHEQKLNSSLNIFLEENTEKNDYFLVDNKQEPCYDFEPSAVVPIYYYYEYFKIISSFIISLVIYFVGS